MGLHSSTTESKPRGLHNQGPPHNVLSLFIFWYSRVGWAPTAPLLKAAQGPPHNVLSPFIFWYFRVGWASTAPLLKAAHGPPHNVLSPFLGYFRVGWASTDPLLKSAQGPPQPGCLHITSCHFLFFGILG